MQLSQVNTFIDTVKNTKSTVIKTLVTDKTFSAPLQAMVDAEAQLAKATVTAFEDLVAKFKVI